MFVGAFLADFPEDDVAAWITSTGDPPAFEPAVGIILEPDETWHGADDKYLSTNNDKRVPVDLLPPHHYNGNVEQTIRTTSDRSRVLIFDTSANLAIPSHKDDFVGSVRCYYEDEDSSSDN